jgi:ATP-dependent exoDNAse (exonuclease V) beta subunit
MITTKQSEESREEASAVSSEGNIKCMTVHKSKGLEFTTVMLPFGDQSLDKMKKGLVDVLILPDSNKLKIGYAVRKEEAFEYIKNNHYKREEEREKRHKLQEEVRILYVAMTRAIKRFVYFRNEESDAAMNWQNLIREGSL